MIYGVFLKILFHHMHFYETALNPWYMYVYMNISNTLNSQLLCTYTVIKIGSYTQTSLSYFMNKKIYIWVIEFKTSNLKSYVTEA